MIPLRKSTASQEVLLGPFLDDTDGKTAETGLTINASDIKLWKRGGTTEADKNSGGATHIAGGRYYAVLDATDTDTVGELILNVSVAGALPVRLVCCVFEAAVFDALFASGAAGYQVPIWSSASATVNLSATTFKAVTDAVALPSSASINITGNLSGSVGSIATGGITAASFAAGAIDAAAIAADAIGSSELAASAVTEIASGVRSELTTELGRIDATVSSRSSHSAADVWAVATRTLTAFSFSVTVGTNNDKTGYSLATAPLDASGTAAAVWGASLTTYTTAGTFGGRIVRSDSSNVLVKLTGSAHIAADIHELQPAVIEAQHFALGAIDANAVAADASSEIATAVRTELATELARIDVTVGSRLADADYTAPPSAMTIADTVLARPLTTAEATAGTISLCTLVLALTGKANVTGGVLTVYRTNGSTVHATIPVASDPTAEPIVGIG